MLLQSQAATQLREKNYDGGVARLSLRALAVRCWPAYARAQAGTLWWPGQARRSARFPMMVFKLWLNWLKRRVSFLRT